MSQITEDAWAIFVGKVNRSSKDLRDAYVDLQDLITPSRGAGGGPSAPDPFPQAPINVDVLDLIQEIDWESDRLRDVVRAALRMRPVANAMPRVYLTISNLEFVTKAVPALWDTHPAAGEDVVDTLWRLSGAAKRRTSTGGTYLSERPCTACSERSVMVDPTRAISRCATCGNTQDVKSFRPVVMASDYVPPILGPGSPPAHQQL